MAARQSVQSCRIPRGQSGHMANHLHYRRRHPQYGGPQLTRRKVVMKRLWELMAWFHRSDLRMITLCIVLCGGILIALLMAGGFNGSVTTELSGPIGRR